MAASSTPLTSRVVTTAQTYQRFEPFSDWVPSLGVDAAQALVVLTDSNQLEVTPAWQLATSDPRVPSTPKAFESSPTWLDTDGRHIVALSHSDFATDVAAAFWIRFGVLFRADHASNTGQAEIALSIVTVES